MAPSTSRSPSHQTGGRMPGSERLARTARHAGPRRCTTTSARERLAETQKNSVQRSSISTSPAMVLKTCSTRRPDDSETRGSVGWRSARVVKDLRTVATRASWSHPMA